MKKNIIFLIDSLQTGGAEKSLLEITARFREYTPIFLPLFPGDRLKPLFDKAGIRTLPCGLPRNYKFNAIARQVYPEIKKLNPAIIHSTLFHSDMVARQLKNKLDVPLINSFVNNSYSKDRYAKLSATLKVKLYGIQLWDRWTANKADLFISNSQTIKQTNADALKIPLNKIKVIYRGRSADKFSPLPEARKEAIQKSLGIEGKKIFLNVSRLLERKGQKDLLTAFQKVKERYADSVLLIAGEGAYSNELENKIAELNLGDAVSLLGNRDDVPDLLRVADYFVFPSYFEGLPGALIEAMMAKIPIIASEIPENLECISPEVALLHRPGRIAELANKMIEAIETDKKQWDIKGHLAYKKAMDSFDIHSIARQYESAYNELIATHQ